MRNSEFDSQVRIICQADPRYRKEAYHFIREALTYAQNEYDGDDENLHVTGQQLLESIRQFAIGEYGPMAGFLLNEWGVYRCEDFGEIVYNLIEFGLFQKDDRDRKDHFAQGYDFYEAFYKPYLPSRHFQKKYSNPAVRSTTSAQSPKT